MRPIQGHRTVALAVAVQLIALQMSYAGDGRWTGRCEQIIDGDTIIVKRDRERVEINISGIDSPEIGQPFGREAAEFATRQLKGKIVTVIPVTAPNSALTGHVEIFGKDYVKLVTNEGLAWYYPRTPADHLLVKAENDARGAGRGLWADPRPTPPWIWRAGNRPGVFSVPGW